MSFWLTSKPGTQFKNLMTQTLDSSDETGVAILNRVIHPDDATLTPDAARTFLSLRFEKEDERRMNRLAAKARRGTLTDREQAAAEQYNMVSHMLALLQAKARQSLKRHDAGSASA
jgi:hypothetical protein